MQFIKVLPIHPKVFTCVLKMWSQSKIVNKTLLQFYIHYRFENYDKLYPGAYRIRPSWIIIKQAMLVYTFYYMPGCIMVWAPYVSDPFINLYLVNVNCETIDPASPNSVRGFFIGRSWMNSYLGRLEEGINKSSR